MPRMNIGLLTLASALLAAILWGPGAWAIESRPVNFAEGATSTTLKGTLRGDQTIDYRLPARAGQTMNVVLKTRHSANYFNVLPPGSNDVAVFIGSRDGNAWRGTLATDGEYTIRVYLMRSAARRNESASYTLTVGLTGGTPVPAGLGAAPAGDAKVPGTPYHATGSVPCSSGSATAGSSQCAFGVIRGARGNAEVHLTSANGSRRVLTFRGSGVSATDGARVQAGRSDDNWIIDVNGHEHYRIPDAVINGG